MVGERKKMINKKTSKSNDWDLTFAGMIFYGLPLAATIGGALYVMNLVNTSMDKYFERERIGREISEYSCPKEELFLKILNSADVNHDRRLSTNELENLLRILK
jgi:hypothetical protein